MRYVALRFLFIAFLGSMTSPVEAQDSASDGNTALTVSASRRDAPINNKWTDCAEFQGNAAAPENTKNMLWYRKSAKVWQEALPIGNGRLGAMVFGGVSDERIQLNENTVWDGYPLDPNNPEGRQALPEVQRLLFKDKNNEAVKLAEATMLGKPERIRPYQSLGEVWFDTPELTALDFIRNLDTSTAVSSVSYNSNGVKFSREYFASAPDNVIVVRMTANRKDKINLSLTMKRQQDAIVERVMTD